MKNIKELIKKNLMTIIWGVIALAAIGAIFWPINGLYDDLKGRLDARRKVNGDLQTMLQKARHTPQIPGGAEQAKLEHFPTKSLISVWQGVTKQVQDESSQIFTAAVDMNKRPLLVEGALPIPASTSVSTNFRRKYKSELDLTDETIRKTTALATQILKAGYLPSDQAINEAKVKLEEELTAQAPKNVTTGLPLDPNFPDMIAKKKDMLPDEMKAKVAENCLIYVEPTSLDPQIEMLNLQGPAPEAGPIFIAQVGYWIQKDVLESLREANKGSKSVKDAPVKHLWKLKFWSSSFSPLLAGSAPPDAANQSSDPAGEWKPNYSFSPTGRTTNGVYDVYRFSLRLFVDADQVNRVLRELTRAKLVNILWCDVVSRDSSEYQMKGYFYGDKPIVQLDLQCEALLLRDWTVPLMPPSIRTALGVKPPAAS